MTAPGHIIDAEFTVVHGPLPAHAATEREEPLALPEPFNVSLPKGYRHPLEGAQGLNVVGYVCFGGIGLVLLLCLSLGLVGVLQGWTPSQPLH